MKRRPPKEALLLDPDFEPDSENHKKVKKALQSSLAAKESFIFTIKKPHTKFITLSNVDVKQDSVLTQERFVTISIEPEDLEPIETLSTEAAKKYLNECLRIQAGPNADIELEDEDKENDPETSNEKEPTVEELYKMRERLIFKLCEDNYKIVDIAETFGIKKEKVWRIHAKVRNELNYEINHQGPKPLHEPRKFVVSKAMLDELDSFMSQKANTTATLQIMRNHLAQVFHLPDDQLSPSTVCDMLKKLNYSRKRARNSERNRNIEPSLDKRQQVALKVLSALKAGLKMIFIDETGFHQGLMPLYGYSKVGQACLVASEANFQKFTVVTAVTKERILGFQIFKGSVETSDYGAFLANLVKYNPELLKDRSKYALFMDNAPIHHARSLKPFMKHFNILYGAPYSPFLNPIEEIFAAWKHLFRNKFGQNKEISTRILEAAQEIDEASLLLYFNHSLTFMKDCLNMKPIQ